MANYKKKVDKNQAEIIKRLKLHDVFIVHGMDDFLAYDDSDNLTQVEVKKATPFNKNGKLEKGFIKDSQYKMLWNANDNYIILWTVEQALDHIVPDGYFGDDEPIYPSGFRNNYKEWLTEKELCRLRYEGIITDNIKTQDQLFSEWMEWTETKPREDKNEKS